jgi:predicted transcriptional regulator of viral defense system
MKKALGNLEMRLFAYAQMREIQAVRLGDLSGPLRLSMRQQYWILSRLARAGMIARVRPGLYLLPPRLPLGGRWSPDETLALNTLMGDLRGRYQVCGPNAFNRYGLDEQVPVRVFAYNNRISGERTIGAVALTLIKVADDRLGGTEDVPSREGAPLVYSSRARTLVDAVYDWPRFRSLPRAYDWIRRELSAKRVRAEELVETSIRYGNMGTVRRIGALLEREGVPERLLRKLERSLGSTTCLIPWVPGRPTRGKANPRWGVVFNERE